MLSVDSSEFAALAQFARRNRHMTPEALTDQARLWRLWHGIAGVWMRDVCCSFGWDRDVVIEPHAIWHDEMRFRFWFMR